MPNTPPIFNDKNRMTIKAETNNASSVVLFENNPVSIAINEIGCPYALTPTEIGGAIILIISRPTPINRIERTHR
jgi:hypothetical protein